MTAAASFKPTASRSPILIAGAGIGGLTAALALLRRGRAVQVVEQAGRLGEVGAGLQLSANSTRALWQLGLGPALLELACEPAGKEVRLWNTGQTWKLFDLGAESVAQYGYPYLTIYRPDFHRVLVDAVRAIDPEAIRLGARVAGFDDTPAGDIQLRFADGSSATGRALIGADGVHSVIRRQLFGDAEAYFSGCLAWRGVIPAKTLPARLLRPVGANWVGPGRHVIHYPLHGGELLNFVGIVERSDWQVESWTQQGTHAECHADFAGWHDDVHTLIDGVQTPFKWALMSRHPLPRWSVGRVTLIGDACHPTLPFLAQGAGMAVEDGYLLARAIDEAGGQTQRNPGAVESSAGDDNDGLADALQRYQSARIPRTTEIVLRSTENGRRFHNPALASADGAAAYVDREWSEPRVRERYDWLFRYNVDEVLL